MFTCFSLFLFIIYWLAMIHCQQTPDQACSTYKNDRDPMKFKNCMMTQNAVQHKRELEKAKLINSDCPTASPSIGLLSSITGGSSPASIFLSKISDQPTISLLSDLSGTYQCLDIPCYCKGCGGTTNPDDTCTVNNNGKQVTFGKALRKECRTLNATQWSALINAIQTLKWGPGQSTYNSKVYQHRSGSAPTAHGDPMFPPWHREFLKRYEFDIRQVDPTVALCYWDSSLDDQLDDSRDSCIWTADFWGEMQNNQVKNGPFSNWTTVDGYPLSREFSGPKGCISSDDAQAIPNYDMLSIHAFTTDDPDCTNTSGIQAQYYPFEYIHGGPHNFIGGDMGSTQTSPNDPCFYHHHAYIDYLYEAWRAVERSQGNDPTTYYPQSQIVNDHCADMNNSLNVPMQPFTEINNQVSLGNEYLDNLYSYLPSPTCSSSSGCGSPYLFCCYNSAPIRCVARIKPGGNCTKFSTPPTSDQTTLTGDDINPCYKSQCVNGQCIATTSVKKRKPRQVAEKTKGCNIRADSRPAKVQIPSFRTCFDYHECCPKWNLDGYCRNDSMAFFMNSWCPATCGCDGCMTLPRLRSNSIGGDCTDIHPACQQWLKQTPTLCQDKAHFMQCNCARSCRFCSTQQGILNNLATSLDTKCSGGPIRLGYYVGHFQLNLSFGK